MTSERTSLEQAESLEQLRWLENAFPIHTEISAYQSIGIDTPADMEKALNLNVDIVHGPIRKDDMIEIGKELVLYAA